MLFRIFIASNFLPNEVHKKNENQLKYYQKHKKRLLNDYLAKELKAKERIILINEHFVVLIPYWAYWPFETIILPLKRNLKRLIDLSEEEKHSLADILKRLLVKYDNLFECSFPYAFGWHGNSIVLIFFYNSQFRLNELSFLDQSRCTYWKIFEHRY